MGVSPSNGLKFTLGLSLVMYRINAQEFHQSQWPERKVFWLIVEVGWQGMT